MDKHSSYNHIGYFFYKINMLLNSFKKNQAISKDFKKITRIAKRVEISDTVKLSMLHAQSDSHMNHRTGEP